MNCSPTTSRNAALLAVAGLLTIAALGLGTARAQLQDPPLGWDAWDPGWTKREQWQPDRMDPSLRWRITRHEAFIRDGVPDPYGGARNPLAQTPVTVRAGASSYRENCTACHDPAGTGHGDAGLALYPSPALLAHMIRMPTAADEYLMWAISEGGKPFGTEMPAFKDKLAQDQIWEIITFMRAGFPAAVGAE